MKQQIIKFLKYVLPWLVTVLSLFFVIKGINFGQLSNVFLEINFSVLVLAIFSSVIFTLYVCVYKYKAILNYLGHDIPFKDVQAIKLGVLPMKAFIPFKVGEFVRAIHLNRSHNVPYWQGIYSIVLGYLLRGVILGIFVIASFMSSNKSLWLVITILLFALVAVLFKDVFLIFYSILLEICLLLNYFVILKSAGVSMSMMDFFIYIPIILFLESLPVSVYGFGVREGLFVLFLGKSLSMEKAVICGLVSSFTNSVIPMVISLFFVSPFVVKLMQRKSQYELLSSK